MKPYIKYAQDVVSGSIVAGEYIKLACQRFLDDIERPDLFFDEGKVEKAIKFIQSLKHYTGKHAGKAFILEPWQSWIVANLVGLYNVEDGKPTSRKYKSSYIEVSRKNGKTFLASALCLYFFLADGEPAAQCILAANSKAQSKIAFTMCSTLMRQLDPKSKYTKSYRDNILFGNSELKVIAADDSKLDGMNCSFYLLDEFHAAKTSKIRDVLKSSMSMRYSPLECIITTAGFDKTGPCFLLRTTATEVLSNVKTDDSFFAAIYSLDVNDAWDN
jgi:phage terminase large subunit-like protein